jgi:hypothetical protein
VCKSAMAMYDVNKRDCMKKGQLIQSSNLELLLFGTRTPYTWQY